MAAVSTLYVTKPHRASIFATLTITQGLQGEITSNTGSITATQHQLITLGTGQVTNETVGGTQGVPRF